MLNPTTTLRLVSGAIRRLTAHLERAVGRIERSIEDECAKAREAERQFAARHEASAARRQELEAHLAQARTLAGNLGKLLG